MRAPNLTKSIEINYKMPTVLKTACANDNVGVRILRTLSNKMPLGMLVNKKLLTVKVAHVDQ